MTAGFQLFGHHEKAFKVKHSLFKMPYLYCFEFFLVDIYSSCDQWYYSHKYDYNGVYSDYYGVYQLCGKPAGLHCWSVIWLTFINNRLIDTNL